MMCNMILPVSLLFISFLTDLSSNRLPKVAIDCHSNRLLMLPIDWPGFLSLVSLHPAKLRVGPPRFFIVGSDQLLIPWLELFDQQIN